MEVERTRMKKIFLVICLCLSSVICAAQVKTQAAADEQLLSCVENDDAGCVARALAAGADADTVDKKRVAVLTLAAEGKSVGVVKLLLAAGADVNAADSDEATPLCRAALFGHGEVVEILLGAGAKINAACGGHGDTPLMEALLGAMMTSTPNELKEAITETVEGDAGDKKDGAASDEETRVEDEKLRRVFSTPNANFIAVARLLLARGADVNVVAKCDVGENALRYAALGANVEMVKELLSRGAKVDQGMNELAWLQAFEREYGRAKGLTLPALSKEQTATLAWLEKTEGARAEIRQLLRAAGAKEDADDKRADDEPDAEALEEAADEAFTSAIKKNDVKDLERLVKAYMGDPLGASVLPSALRTAVIYDRPEMVKLLLARGVDPNSGRYNALMHAANEGEAEYVRMLVEAGADVNATDDDGKTPLDYAESWAGSSGGHDAVIEILKTHGAKSGKQK